MPPTVGVMQDEEGNELYDDDSAPAVAPRTSPTPVGGLMAVDLGTPPDSIGGGSPLDSAARHETAAVLASLANGSTPPVIAGAEVSPTESDTANAGGTKRPTPVNTSRHTKAKQGAPRTLLCNARHKRTACPLVATEPQKDVSLDFNQQPQLLMVTIKVS
ncbi:hypothetical protein SEMRO_2670_G334280.1 [Seminavis robusta]|uniref:Uncharacterized protein n=1 Tax=Seminavis robusta TaxID=568900 RepID=A0A9N8HY23_9STRA|nr:hypothetical protein SEMRO_2670_G334280.1 [Seminavis robusta]|eukprot:Sro2670_g334280.1 n/a (160) ;mRNA; r:2409-2888